MDTQQMLEEVEREIERLEAVATLLRGGSATSSKRGKKGKRKLSRKARKAISDAQKARWAKVKAPKKKAE